MDTAGMRITAVVATMLDGFEPSSWTRLPGTDADRVLVTDGDRTFVASVAKPEREAAAQAERVASAALQPLLPESAPAIPRIIASRTVAGSLVERDGEVAVMVSAPMPGLPLSTSMFDDYPRLVESLSDAMAALHSADPGPIADAGLVVEDSTETRERLLADLDSAASTGRVPARLLGRWEKTLEDVSAWRFLAVPVHGNLGPDALWAEEDAVVGVGDLARLRVGDPAADLAAVSSMLTPEDFERFFRTYRSRRSTDDPGLRLRVGFHSEITVLEWLLAAVAAQDDDAIEDAAHLLDALADVTFDTDDDFADTAGWDDGSSDEESEAGGPGSEERSGTASAAPGAPSGSSTRQPYSVAGGSGGIFRPSAPIDGGFDEDAIATENLDTSELHLHPEDLQHDLNRRDPHREDQDGEQH